MSDAISVDGIRYIATAEAGERAALSSDYIASLARHGHIRAKQAGRQWYIDPRSLDAFLAVQNTLKGQRSAQLSAELRSVAERTGKFARVGAAYPAHARTPSSFIPPEIAERREPSHVFEKLAASTLAIALTFGAATAASPNARASVVDTIARLTAIGNGLANLAAVSAPVTSENGNANSSPATSAQIAATSTENESQTSGEPIETATSYTTQNPSIAHGATSALQSDEYADPTAFLANATPAFDASDFVTQNELDAQLLQITNALSAKFTAPATSSLPQNVAADGNNFSPYVPIVPPINNLSNVTITNANLTASEIPPLDYFPATNTVSISYGGTGISNAPSYGELLLGDGSGGYTLAATSSLGIVSGGAPGGVDAEVQFNSGGMFAGSSAFTFASSTNLLTVTNASTSNFSVFSNAYFGGTATSSFDSAGDLTVAGNTSLQNATSTNLFATIASSTNLFAQTASLDALAAGTLSFGNLASAVLAVNQSGQVVATSSIGANLLSGTLATINGASLSAGGTITITAASSTLLANNNTWTGLQQFGNASTSLETDSALWLPNVAAGSLLKTNASGEVAAAVAGTDYQAPITASYPLSFSGNNLSLAFGTTTANAWSQMQTLQSGFLSQASSTIAGPLTLTGTLSAQGATFVGTLAAQGGGTLAGTFSGSPTFSATPIFSSGLLSLASTTIGNGTQAGGLTINGGATTTGPVVIGGTASSSIGQLSVMAGSNTITRVSQTTLADGASGKTDNIYVQGRYAYIVEGAGGADAFQIFDVSTSSPSLVGQANLVSSVGGVSIVVQGRYAYITDKGPDLEVFDVSNPASPTLLIATAITGSGLNAVAVSGRYLYIANSALTIYDISNPSSPTLVSQTSISGAGGIFVQGRYAYIQLTEATTNAFQIYDISNPASPTLVSETTSNYLFSIDPAIYVQGTLAYINDGDAVTIYNVSNPASPVAETIANTSGCGGGSGITSIKVQGRYLYAVAGRALTDAFCVMDVSNPAAPISVSTNNLANGSGSSEAAALFVSGRYAYIVEGSGTGAAFEVFDLGGEYAQQLEAGGIEAGTLSLRNNLSAVDGMFSGGLGVGGSLQVTGSASILSASSTYNTTANIFNIATASSTTPILTVLGNGDVGVGTLAAGTANSLCYNTSAITGMDTLSTCSSDERLKQDITSLDGSTSLAQLMELNPVSFNWNPQFASGTPEQFGLIAQQVQQVWPNLVSTTSPTALTPDGTLSLNFNGLFGPIVAAVQEIANIGGTFETNLIAWLGNAQNGIGALFAQVGNFQTTNTQTLNASSTNSTAGNFQQVCITNGANDPAPLCLTKSQLAALLSAAGASQTTESETSSASNTSDSSLQNPTPQIPESDASNATDTPPVIQVNGDNPAIMQVGDTYNDLGATITGPQQDLNLGIETFVNGAPMSPVQIDTSEAATDTIEYVATDQNGLTSTSTRIVIIEAPSIVPSDAASSTDANSTDDAATSTSS